MIMNLLSDESVLLVPIGNVWFLVPGTECLSASGREQKGPRSLDEVS